MKATLAAGKLRGRNECDPLHFVQIQGVSIGEWHENIMMHIKSKSIP